MKKIIVYCLLFISQSLFGAEIVELADEIRLPVPTDWTIYSDSSGYPYTIINEDETVELSIHKSNISENAKIHTKDDLKLSVDQIIRDVIFSLPDGFYYTNTGEYSDNSLNFTLEFISTDTVTNEKLFHRLKGILYNHPDGHQILFTLWGRSNEVSKDILRTEVLFSQNNFVYIGPVSDMKLTEPKQMDWFYILLVVLLCTGVLYFFKTFSRKQKGRMVNESYLWRCSCGQQNQRYDERCKKCGVSKNSEVPI